jgi:hypothetical protein
MAYMAMTLHTFTVEQYMALDIPELTELLEGLIYDLPSAGFAK